LAPAAGVATDMAAKLTILPALVATVLAVAAASAPAATNAALSAPTALSPAGGATVDSVPPFAWTPVQAADHYEFQLSADAGFNSPVLGHGSDDFTTQNTRATVLKTIPNGTYYWRVRAIGAGGSVSAWTAGRSFRKAWTAAAALQSPAGGTGLSFGTDPLKLGWSAVPGAANYLVSVATDPSLGSLAFHLDQDPNGIPKVQANSLAISLALATGTYYWNVIPVDAEGNRGAPSATASFSWTWPSTTTLHVTDLNSADEVYDPQFYWDPVAGAARYEVEINSSSDFAAGSKVCCDSTTIATSLSPTNVFKDNTFYWRVRAIDPDGNAGVWNVGPSFTKTFDKVPVVAAPAIKNLRLRDNLADPGTDQDANPANGYQTHVPMLTWDWVPGASSYEVDVTPFNGSFCDWGATSHHWRVDTAVNAWTPLGDNWFASKPYSDPLDVSNDFTSLVAGQYCARVRARSDRAGFDDVYGDYTYLDPDGLGWAFEFTGYPAGGACTPSCTANYLGSGDFTSMITGTSTGRVPYFTWKPLAGKQSYYVLVAKDPSFSNLVDYAWTKIPAYAPRTGFGPRTYPDETTLYYWAVLPATNADGTGAVGNPLLAAPQSFQKQSTPPTRLAPADGTQFYNQPSFRWTPTEGARRYRLQVAQDPSFGNPIDDLTTDSTSYTSNTTYPADTVLYWRVRADDENSVGLTWSTTGTFQKRLAAPVPSPTNPTAGEYLPVWSWSSVNGAASYDLSIDQPDGQTRNFSDFRMPATSFQTLTGTGVFHWRVRAEFPNQGFGKTPGPWSASMPFTRTIGEPGGLKTDATPDHVLLSWNPKLGVKEYRVQVSGRPDFSTTVEDVTTENTSYAPKLSDVAYLSGNQLYWRVAGVDADDNVGDFSPAQPLSLLPRLKVTVKGSLRKRRRSTVSVTVKNASGTWMKGVKVRITGAGVRAQTRSTSMWGVARFTVRPTKRGRVLFTARKSGFQTAGITLRVR
jgi:hypothetical protein